MSDSLQPHGLSPARLLSPWDSPGKSTGVGCHFLLQCVKVKSESEVVQSCPTRRSHGLQCTRLLSPWDSPGKSTGVGCHCLLWSWIQWTPILGNILAFASEVCNGFNSCCKFRLSLVRTWWFIPSGMALLHLSLMLHWSQVSAMSCREH